MFKLTQHLIKIRAASDTAKQHGYVHTENVLNRLYREEALRLQEHMRTTPSNTRGLQR